MNRFFEFRLDYDLICELPVLKHPRCGWETYLSTADDGTVALDSVMKHASDHVCGEGDLGS